MEKVLCLEVNKWRGEENTRKIVTAVFNSRGEGQGIVRELLGRGLSPQHTQLVSGDDVFVRAAGAHVSDKTLRKPVPLCEGNVFDRALVEEGKRNLMSHFHSKGYFNLKLNCQNRHAINALKG
jgi:hypothetical protein